MAGDIYFCHRNAADKHVLFPERILFCGIGGVKTESCPAMAINERIHFIEKS